MLQHLFGRHHINLTNKIAILTEKAKGATLSPDERELFALLRAAARRIERQAYRGWKREQKHSSWPYCGKRHRARIARQVAAGTLRAENGLAVS